MIHLIASIVIVVFIILVLFLEDWKNNTRQKNIGTIIYLLTGAVLVTINFLIYLGVLV
jgi:heme A synthase